MDLKTFLLARIAEDEKLAEAAVISRYGERHKDRWDYTSYVIGMDRDSTAAQDEFVTEFWPARVLAECAAKRAIIGSYQSCTAMTTEEQEPGVKLVGAGMTKGLHLALQSLAAVYADHPDYQPEWAQEGMK